MSLSYTYFLWQVYYQTCHQKTTPWRFWNGRPLVSERVLSVRHSIKPRTYTLKMVYVGIVTSVIINRLMSDALDDGMESPTQNYARNVLFIRPFGLMYFFSISAISDLELHHCNYVLIFERKRRGISLFLLSNFSYNAVG